MKRHPQIPLSHWTTPATNREQGFGRRAYINRRNRERAVELVMQRRAEEIAFQFERYMAQTGEERTEPRVIVQ